MEKSLDFNPYIVMALTMKKRTFSNIYFEVKESTKISLKLNVMDCRVFQSKTAVAKKKDLKCNKKKQDATGQNRTKQG